MTVLLIVLLLFFLTFCIPLKEGLEDDYLHLAIKAIQSSKNDVRMTDDQKIAIDDALSYANYIKHTIQ